MQNQDALSHNVEKQIGQLAKAFSKPQQGSLPGNTEANPREHVKAVTLKSGKALSAGEKFEKQTNEETTGKRVKNKNRLTNHP